ncbi:DUF951 domain-containing protein [Anaerofustis sp.]|uniref:DUF951 domain-containing protein n=1 Tax=Anaerofustis sp. TaxID=1872517 RepID=UPI0025BFA4A9|nr:DUF951 domain-containing protein [Anaerofustis sp.]
MENDFLVNDIVIMKKEHPCGSNEWKIIRIGMDVKLQCMGCGRIIVLQRNKFNKSIKCKK